MKDPFCDVLHPGDGPFGTGQFHPLRTDRSFLKRQQRHNAHHLVFRVTPLVCVGLTMAMLILPGWSSVSHAVVCFFTYSLLHSVQDDGSASPMVYLGINSERNVITVVMLLYLPVIYLWQATGRLAKVKGGCYEPEPLMLPWKRKGQKGQKVVAEYLRYLWSMNLKVWKYSDYWNQLFSRTRLRGSAGAKRAGQRLLKFSKFGSGRACVKAQEARRGGQKDWKELKKAWELKSWRDRQHCDVLTQYNSRYSLYRRLPLKTLSRLWGQFHQLRLPVWLRSPAFRLYIWMFSCRLDEAAVTDLRSYHNLSEFFRRQLRRGVRPLDQCHCMVSPADGRVLHQGPVTSGVLEQVKGVTYSIQGFLGPGQGLLHPVSKSNVRDGLSQALQRYRNISSLHLMMGVAFDYDLELLHLKPLKESDDSLVHHPVAMEIQDNEAYIRQLLVHPENQLHFSIIYLAPGDYHRFHSPVDWTVYSRRHFPGELFSVNPGVARWLQGLFNFNERAVYCGRWRHGFFSMTAVGATNVGSINVYFDEDLTTNVSDHEPGTYFDAYFNARNGRGRGIKVKKGQAIGDFNLGSTIVLVFEAPRGFTFTGTPGKKVKVGEAFGHYRSKVMPRGRDE